MKLSDLRKIAIKKNVRIGFRLPNGMECKLDEHGVARVAALRAAPDFNLEDEVGRALSFTLEPAAPGAKGTVQTLTREQFTALASAGETVPREERED